MGWWSLTCVLAAAVGLVPTGAGAQDTVRVLSYNILHGTGMDRQIDLERTAAVIRAVTPDVVLLQEVDSCTGRTYGVAQAQTLAELTGLPHYAFGRFMEYDGGAYGMAVLSASPILEHETHVLPEGAEPRSALAARIRPSPSAPELVFVGIHLYRTEAERFAQAKALVDRFAEETAPVLLVGDFNSEPGNPVMRLLGTQWKLPAKPTDDRLTWPADEPRLEIDHVMYRPEEQFQVIEYRVIDERVASDHRPVLLTVVLR
jgi:endonuclease/exonuclease/phosphatase family metal-dependent hydrolase